MPELPEVETITRALREGSRGYAALSGRVFHSAEILWNRTLVEPELPVFYHQIQGQPIQNISRRGKYIHFQLDDISLVFHLRMSGDFRTLSTKQQNEGTLHHVHDRAVFTFSDGLKLFFNDARKFGRIWLLNDVQRLFDRLGPEPFDPQLTAATFYEMLHRRQRILKPLLMDQTFLAGTGNIYADEGLHLARLHPCRLASSLSFREAENLLEALREVFSEGIKRQGASIDWVYRGGAFQDEFRVYQRTGKPCLTCGTMIERIIVGQRGTHYCPVCQPQK